MLCFFPKFGWEENQEKRTVTKNLLQDSKSIRLLRIENGIISSSVLTEICNLRQLTYLKLAGRVGELPSAISNLKSLLTLDLQESWGIYVPNVIWSMKQLRHLLLPVNCRWDSLGKFQRRVEFSLTNLQTLSGLAGEFEVDWLYKLNSLRTLGVFNPTETWSKDIIEVLSDGAPVSHKLEKLWFHTVIDKWSSLKLPELKSNSLNLSRYENLCSLDVDRIKMIELPQHDKLPPNLTVLTLAFTYIEKDPMETLKKLQKLKILKLLTNSYSGTELVCSGEDGNFPELEIFEIGYLDIERVVVEEGGMPRLKDFKFSKYGRDTKMPEIQIPDRLRNIIVMTTK